MTFDLETIYLPDDAGEYADGLLRILTRIPPRWGRWIGCDKGWYPLLIELDEKLAAIFPEYELHQVKEKFGTLRYYIGFPDLEPECCTPIQESRPCEGAVDPRGYNVSKDRTLNEQYELTKWFYTDLIPHVESEEHDAGMRALEPERMRRNDLLDQMEAVIREYENLSAVTCEISGTPGVLMHKGYWYKTLNPEYAPEGYEVFTDDEE